MSKRISLSDEVVINKIYWMRGQKVMLDKDLAALYDVMTRNLNKAVRRNLKRFPVDFIPGYTQGISKLDVPNWNIKLGGDEENALCIHRTRGCHAIQRIK